MTQNVILSNNTIAYNDFAQVSIQNQATYAFFDPHGSYNVTQNVTLTGNTLNGNGIGSGSAGIVAQNYADNKSTATQTVDLSGGGNTISNNDYGVFVGNYFSGSGTATQTIDLSGGNTFSDNKVDVYATVGSQPTQTITGGP